MEQKIIATVGGHQITEAEVEAFIHSLPREQQVYAAHPDFRKQCEEQLIAVYAFAKYGEEEKIDETEEFKNVMENARKDILAQMAMRKLFATVNVTDDEIKEYYEANKSKYSKGASVHAKHILVDNEEKCTELLNAITSGEKVFEDVAKESSTCPSGANGGRPWRIRKRTDGKRVRRCRICCRGWTCCRSGKDTVWISPDQS